MDKTMTAIKAANPENIIKALGVYGSVYDKDIDLAAAALLLARLNNLSSQLERFENHILKLSEDVGTRYKLLRDAGADDDTGTRLAALKYIIAEQKGYAGDTETPNHMQNFDLMRVIDRGKGTEITLGILYIATARKQGWEAYGLDIAGYFAVRLDYEGHRIIFDPYQDCKVLAAPQLRQIVKDMRGEHAELSAEYYEPITNREILIKLENIVKTKYIETEDYERALLCVQAMQSLAPEEYRLLLDAGVLYARTAQPEEAAWALEQYIERAPDPSDRREAALLLHQVREMIPT